jgi:hypothetical protein
MAENVSASRFVPLAGTTTPLSFVESKAKIEVEGSG